MFQSPIAISSFNAIVEDDLPPLEFHNHWAKEGNAILANNGNNAKVSFVGRTKQPYIVGGTLKANEKYIFQQMHFHWAENDSYGSEHVVNGKT